MSIATTPIKFDSADTFRATNLSDHAIVLEWSKRKWLVQPGESTFVPFDVVRLYFGDPRSMPGISKQFHDSKHEGDIPKREDELKRLAILYGKYEQGIDEVPEVVPLFRIETADGREVTVPAFDPNASAYSADTDPVDINNITDVKVLLSKHETEMKELRRHYEHLSANGNNTTSEITTDGDEFTNEEFAI